jgi:hypothetical protein
VPFLRKTLKIASRSEVGIQGADLYAREVMKHLDNTVGPVQSTPHGIGPIRFHGDAECRTKLRNTHRTRTLQAAFKLLKTGVTELSH